jgi:hypothetical protein
VAASRASTAERRRAASLARHYRDVERMSIGHIATRLGRAPATVREYLYDPEHCKAKRVKDSYRGTCSGCGGRTSGAGPTRPRRLCARCNGHASAKWNRELIAIALRSWNRRYGTPATSVDLSRHYATRHGGERLRRLKEGWRSGQPWPAASVVQYHYGSVRAANAAALKDDHLGADSGAVVRAGSLNY